MSYKNDNSAPFDDDEPQSFRNGERIDVTKDPVDKPVNKTASVKKAQEFHSWNFEANILLNDWCTANTAIVYSYMLSRYMWFKKEGKDYFESQEIIMNAVHLSESTIKRSIKMLKDKGYLSVKAVKGQQYKRNIYIVLDKHGTYANMNKKTSTNKTTLLHKPIKPSMTYNSTAEDFDDPF